MKFGSRLAALASATAVAAFGLVMGAPPAFAHDEGQLRSICGDSSYFIVNDSGGIGGKAKRAVTTAKGERWGYVYLLYSASVKKNCVVTLKTTYHGTPTSTVASLRVEGEDWHTDPPAGGAAEYSHYADVQKSAGGKCVQYAGWVYNPGGYTAAKGGRYSWDNCG